ncbi:MAG: hypothetical protein CMI30_04510 [Opitutae bacterium]|nr:hypothetical protein [Opitutae bacterium]|tara:strand:- start:7557 stop:8411 length:855 start_codon:yes stop_codon:yes gene_type:complete
MKSSKQLILALSCLLNLNLLSGQQDVLNLAPVSANETVMAASFKDGAGVSFLHLSETLESSLMTALNDAKKFKVLYQGKGSEPQVIKEEEGVRNVRLITVIDDFQDYEQKAILEGLGEVIAKRTVRLGLVASLFDFETNELLASSNLRMEKFEVIVTTGSNPDSSVRSEKIIVKIADEAAREMVSRCLDCLSPAKVIGKTGKQITFNRGHDFGYPVGRIVEIFAEGEDLKDPDTGDSLGPEEILVGTAKVRRLTQKFSTAIILEDHGIEKSHTVRLMPEGLNSN